MRKRFVLAVAGMAVALVLAACAPGANQAGRMDDGMGGDDMGGAMEGPMAMDDLMAQGQQIYSDNCAGCHGANGEGGFGVAHAGNEDLQDDELVIDTILNGLGNMPAWADRLDDMEIAAVATYIRNSFGNAFGAIQYPAVRDRR